MRRRLEEDGFLFQAYHLASVHHWPLAVVRRFTIEEFNGWIAYLDIKYEREKAAIEEARNG